MDMKHLSSQEEEGTAMAWDLGGTTVRDRWSLKQGIFSSQQNWIFLTRCWDNFTGLWWQNQVGQNMDFVPKHNQNISTVLSQHKMEI